MPRSIKAKRPIRASDDTLWAAMVARDTSYDGKVYYAVASTGIYCRPACPARLPKRANVSFHTSCAEAEAAGFRACRRCKPDQPSAAQLNAAMVAHACRLIETSVEAPKLDDLAAAVGLSPFHFHRIFKKVAGLTPKAYATAHQNQRVRASLATPVSITQAIHEAGFNSGGRFYALSPEILGMTPTQLRKGAADTVITFATAPSSLGLVLVATTKVGICAVLIGDEAAALTHDLQSRFPKATLNAGSKDFRKLLAAVIRHVEMPLNTFTLPLDVRGTAFQHKVWRALRAIPAGQTVSYADLARRIGKPTAVRAVAGACGANPLAVVVPCHRVVRTDGALSGYRWGIERKRTLLTREAKLKTKS